MYQLLKGNLFNSVYAIIAFPKYTVLIATNSIKFEYPRLHRLNDYGYSKINNQ